jgi:hypothetical protein
MQQHTHTAADILTSPKTLAVPVGLQGINFLGYALSDWVLICTLILVLIQIAAWGLKLVIYLKKLLKR